MDLMTSQETGEALASQKVITPEQRKFLTGALAFYKEFLGEDAEGEEERKRVALAAWKIGIIEQRLVHLEEALQACRRACRDYAKLTLDFPAVPEYRADLAASRSNLGILLSELGRRAEAEKEHNAAMAIEEKLAADFPAVHNYQVSLGGNYCNIGLMIRIAGRPAESLQWFDKAVAILKPVVRQEPQAITARQFLHNSHWGRAQAYDLMGNHPQAVQDWDKAIELSTPDEQPAGRLKRADSQVRAGMTTQAVAEITDLAKSAKWDNGDWYNAACVVAIASGKNAAKRDEYAAQAIDLLRKAVAAGYSDAEHIAKDSDLDALRERADFRELLASLKAKKPPAKGATPPKK